MLIWIFLVRCSSRGTVIFLIVSKEIRKYDQRKFYFFSEKKHFKIQYSRSSLKKNRKNNLQFFFPYTKIAKQKNSQLTKFRIKNFAKYIISQTSNTKEIRENIVTKSSQKYFSEKKTFRQKKFDKKNFHQKKNLQKKNIRNKLLK